VGDVKADEDLQPFFGVLFNELTDCDVVWSIEWVFKPDGPDDIVMYVVD